MDKRYHPTFESIRRPEEDMARTVPEFARSAVMYQMFLRPFTPEGTLAAATRLLPHVASLGVDIIYLCPVTVADDDPRQEYWSARQVASGLGNSRNPYRVKDFFNVDPEYGTAEDLRKFVSETHRLGMRVLFDLVYFHCGPGAVFLTEHPEYVVREADGRFKLGGWRFPELDLSNDAVRSYLYSNMRFWLEEFQADGFRCDVGDMLPVDFWEEAGRRCRAFKPDCLLMCEGLRGDDQHEAFDLTYGFYTQWAIKDILRGKKNAGEIRLACSHELTDYPRGFHWMRCFDNHDFAMDTAMSGGRYEATAGHEACEAMLATIFLLNGLPMLYNGQEVGDDLPHSIFSNREHGKYGINWALALTEAGEERLAFVRKLCRVRHEYPELFDASVEWLETSCPEAVFAFERPLRKGRARLIVNVSDREMDVMVGTEPCHLPPHGFSIAIG